MDLVGGDVVVFFAATFSTMLFYEDDLLALNASAALSYCF